ncbi:FtsK/SpoIIIE domain-containing protein [Fictibacillus gelatini]|uniref:FtsK/SpoIIIE domain-containing protein n=1 Tax=Fictibacillus gelatini TaxID=225985 RepID=UPI00040ACA99|nr:FtsK/SpoIIIE domain-containing protein [Fictibacillus gelatini]
MFFSILSSAVMGSIVGYSYLKQNGLTNDAAKLQRIFKNCGLVVFEDENKKKVMRNVQLYRRKKHEWGTEYVYRIPLGLSSKDFEKKLDHIQDGLNNKKQILDISLDDLKRLNFKQNIHAQLKTLLNKKKRIQKEIELSYDGMLHVKVYEQSLPEELMFSDDLLNQCCGWEVPFGVTRSELIKHDFEKIPHLVLGGTSRYGKSNLLNMLICSLIHKKPEKIRFTLIDLKGLMEFGGYENLKQVAHIAGEPEEARDALKAVVYEMKARQQELRKNGCRKVQEAKGYDRHFVIVDEVGELNPMEAVSKEERQLKEECQTYMSQIARLGAGLGYRQILATQYPTGDVIPRQCKQNSDAKLCFRVQNGTASRVVLDEVGAEELPMIRGRAIYQMPDQRVIVQTPYISSEQIDEIIQPHIQERSEPIAKGDEGGSDPLIIEETWIP